MEKKCETCDVWFSVKPSRPRRFCSRACYATWQSLNCRGANNANYGRRWTDDQRLRASDRQSTLMTSERREAIGNRHRHKTMSEASRRKMSEAHRGKRPYIITEAIRANIGKSSSARYTVEYKRALRQAAEARGEILPLAQKEEYQLYRSLSNWVERMWDRTSETERQELARLGVFNSRSNVSGLVRDHMFSRKSGFELGVFPELLRHPANLQLLTASKNAAKRLGRYRDRDDQTLDELFSKIRAFEGAWKEHAKCLELVQAYEDGVRYDKMDYVTRYYEVRGA